MENHNTSCSICYMSYNEGERRPLVLPCSHSFCQACLEHLEKDNNQTCSYCRKYWGGSKVCDLICCLQLLPNGDTNTPKDKAVPQKCQQHETELSMWCQSCSETICVKCLSLKHKNCHWVLLEDENENSKALYEVAVSHLVETASKTSGVIESLNSLEDKLRTFRAQLRIWQREAEFELAECPMFQASVDTKQDRGEVQEKLEGLNRKQVELSDTTATFMTCLDDVCQVAECDTGDSLRAQLQSLTLTTPSKEACSRTTHSNSTHQADHKNDQVSQPSKSTDQTSVFEAIESLSSNSIFLDTSFLIAETEAAEDPEAFPDPDSSGEHLLIQDTSQISKLYPYLRSSTDRSFVILEGSDWRDPEFTAGLTAIAFYNCRVSLKTLDTFLQPSPSSSLQRSFASSTISKLASASLPSSSSTSSTDGNRFSLKPQSRSLSATKARLDTLVQPGFRCVLTEFWGHLDIEGLQKLPPCLRTLGLALAGKEDLATLRQLIDMDGATWTRKRNWPHPWKLHLSFSQSLRAKDFKAEKKSTGKISFGSKTPLRRLHTTVALHFHRVDAGNLEWMQDIMLLFVKKCSVTDVFLPEAWFTPYFGMGAFNDDALSKTILHLPLYLKVTYNFGKCYTVKWDL